MTLIIILLLIAILFSLLFIIKMMYVAKIAKDDYKYIQFAVTYKYEYYLDSNYEGEKHLSEDTAIVVLKDDGLPIDANNFVTYIHEHQKDNLKKQGASGRLLYITSITKLKRAKQLYGAGIYIKNFYP